MTNKKRIAVCEKLHKELLQLLKASGYVLDPITKRTLQVVLERAYIEGRIAMIDEQIEHRTN